VTSLQAACLRRSAGDNLPGDIAAGDNLPGDIAAGGGLPGGGQPAAALQQQQRGDVAVLPGGSARAAPAARPSVGD
jgi:hypothetical protein